MRPFHVEQFWTRWISSLRCTGSNYPWERRLTSTSIQMHALFVRQSGEAQRSCSTWNYSAARILPLGMTIRLAKSCRSTIVSRGTSGEGRDFTGRQIRVRCKFDSIGSCQTGTFHVELSTSDPRVSWRACSTWNAPSRSHRSAPNPCTAEKTHPSGPSVFLRGH
jgi:hypothetical protein